MPSEVHDHEDTARLDAGIDAASIAADDASTPASDASTSDAASGDPGAQVDAGPAVGYAQVAPLFGKYCVSCHAASGQGPFSLDNYDDASDFAAAAYVAANERIMPPCAASDPSCGPTMLELATLRAWVLQGRPK